MTCLPVIKATSGWVQNGGKYLVYTDQAAVIKAIKEGKTNVDLNAPTTPDNTPGGFYPRWFKHRSDRQRRPRL